MLPLLLPQYFLYLGNFLMMFAVLALGLDLLLGWAGQFAFAHIAFFGIGTYTAALLNRGSACRSSSACRCGTARRHDRSSHRLSGDAPAHRLSRACDLRLRRGRPMGVQRVGRSHRRPGWLAHRRAEHFGLPRRHGSDAFPVMATILALMIAATMYLSTSKFGRAMCAIRESEHVASASGIDVRATKAWAFAISAVYAGVAGGMYTLFQSS